MARQEKDKIILSTGKEFYANRGIIGIGSDLAISEGYDDLVNDSDFTEKERIELADYAIGLWKEYRAGDKQCLKKRGFKCP